MRALSQYSRIEAVRRPAITMLALMIAQLCLGFVAFLTRVAWGHDAVQPELPMVISTVSPCCRRSFAAGHHRGSGGTGLASRAGGICRTRSKPGRETGGRMSTATQPLVVPRHGRSHAGPRLCRTDQAARDHADHHDRVVRLLFWRVEVGCLFPFVGSVSRSSGYRTGFRWNCRA